MDISLFYTGIFAVVFSGYAICDTDLIHLLVGNGYVIYILTFVLLALIPIPCLLLFEQYVDPKFRRLLLANVCLTFGVMFLEILLNFLKIYDFRETLFLTHITEAVAIVSALVVILGTSTKKYPQRNRILISAFPMFLGAAVDLAFFYLPVISQNSLHFQLGVSLFIIIQLGYLMHSYFERNAKYVEAGAYKRMAYVDALTGLANRLPRGRR